MMIFCRLVLVKGAQYSNRVWFLKLKNTSQKFPKKIPAMWSQKLSMNTKLKEI